jgi:hypothetical protein
LYFIGISSFSFFQQATDQLHILWQFSEDELYILREAKKKKRVGIGEEMRQKVVVGFHVLHTHTHTHTQHSWQ